MWLVIQVSHTSLDVLTMLNCTMITVVRTPWHIRRLLAFRLHYTPTRPGCSRLAAWDEDLDTTAYDVSVGINDSIVLFSQRSLRLLLRHRRVRIAPPKQFRNCISVRLRNLHASFTQRSPRTPYFSSILQRHVDGFQGSRVKRWCQIITRAEALGGV